MILGIDASNIRRGGGLTHLVEFLRAADPLAAGFGKVVVWSGKATLAVLEERPWLVKQEEPELNGNLLQRSLWQRFKLSAAAKEAACSLLFVPGGSYAGNFTPMVTLSQNLLPFEWAELFRFGFSFMTLKLLLLRFVQSRTFARAQGLIFLTHYAQTTVLKVIKKAEGKTAIIPHGIEARFSLPPRRARTLSECSLAEPFRLVYVSILDVYKHQDKVAQAVARLRTDGIPVSIDFIGPAYGPVRKRLEKLFSVLDPAGSFIRWTGPIPYQDLHAAYQKADACVFASSCENLPIILLEGMAAGLPIACSSRGPMPEVLGDGGLYFDPENVASIEATLLELFSDAPGRADLAQRSYQATQAYSWERTALQYFSFFAGLCTTGKGY